MKTNVHFFTISCSVLLSMRNVADESVRENQNTHFMFNNFIFLNPAVYEIMWKNNVLRGRPQMTIWGMRFACWIRICNIYYSPTTTMVTRTLLNVTLYVH